MDTLMIQDLQASCRIGVTEAERQTPQLLWLDLEIAIDSARAAAHDDVEQTIDYAQLASSVRTQIESRPVRLLETVAEETAALILDHWHPAWVTVTVKKRALPGLDYAAVRITRPPES